MADRVPNRPVVMCIDRISALHSQISTLAHGSPFIVKKIPLTIKLLVANFEEMQNPWKMTETLAHWYSSWENSARAFKWIPTKQGLDGFQKTLRPYALDETSLSIGRVYPLNYTLAIKAPNIAHYTYVRICHSFPWGDNLSEIDYRKREWAQVRSLWG